MVRISTILLLLFFINILLAENISLEEDIRDGYLDDYSKIEAAFILSGVIHPDSLTRYHNWYNQILNKIKSFSFDVNDPVGSAQTVFIYLHNSWLEEYALESTTLADIARSKEYNCVAATILYNLICEDLGWNCEAFETPTHVYTILNNFQQKIIVENTNHMGFNIMKNLKAYSKYLAQYYPQSEVLRIGLDRLYYHENKNGRLITNTELLGLLAYNRAYLARKNKDYESAYDYVLLAQLFNSDSRSNVRFEIGLYYDWGIQLFNEKKYANAFTVFADGFYRYRDNEGLHKNTLASFFNALHEEWQKKKWDRSGQLINEISDLNILQGADISRVKELLNNWIVYYSVKNDKQLIDEINYYLEQLYNFR
jgi:hypothetical protein